MSATDKGGQVDVRGIRATLAKARETWAVGRGGFNAETNAEYIDALLGTGIPTLLGSNEALLRRGDRLHDDLYGMTRIAGQYMAQRDAALATIAAVRALHVPCEPRVDHCRKPTCHACMEPAPCVTVRLLDGADTGHGDQQ